MSIRDLGFIKWSDKYAKYEKEPAYSKGIKEEQVIYNTAIKSLPTKDIERWVEEFNKLPITYEILYSTKWLNYTIDVRPDDRYIPTIEININGKEKHTFKDLVDYGYNDKNLWLITEGSHAYSLFIYDANLKEHKEYKNVGETAVSTDDTIYYTSAENPFWFNKVVKLTDTRQILYEEREEKYVLYLKKPKYQKDIFVLRKSAIYQDIGILENDKLTWIAKGHGTKLPIDKDNIAYDKWFLHNGIKIKYPTNHYLEDVFLINKDLYFIFTHDIYNSLFLYSENAWHQLIEPTVCEIKLIGSIDSVLIGEPHKPGTILNINKQTIKLYKHLDGPTFSLEKGVSPVPWFSVSDKSRTKKGVVFYGYGSYGMSIRKSQQRLWIPWIKQGFTVVFIATRGGRENGDDWWEKARTSERRINAIQDFVKGVKILQKKLGFNKTNTIIYGRSAGGFLVTAALNHLMNDIAMVYAAKPYTDVLRTTSNLKLGGSLQEADEFGLSTNPIDFLEIFKISPQENIIQNPITNPVILLTGGATDKEVPLYMPLKYAKALRDADWSQVYLRAEKEGHFTAKSNEFREAEDAALCEATIKRRALQTVHVQSSSEHN